MISVTQGANYGVPGHTALDLDGAKRDGWVEVPGFPGEYECSVHRLPLEQVGVVLECTRECRIVPPLP